MSEHQVEITTQGGRGSLLVDGVDIAKLTRRFALEFDAGGIPRLSVELSPQKLRALMTGKVRVEVDPDTRAVLLALGWTPPTETEETP